jgi:hypothetical protein
MLLARRVLPQSRVSRTVAYGSCDFRLRGKTLQRDTSGGAEDLFRMLADEEGIHMRELKVNVGL